MNIGAAVQAAGAESNSTQSAQPALPGEREVIQAEAPKDLIVARSAVINARVKRVLFKGACTCRDQVVCHAPRCGCREQGKHRRGLWRNTCVRNLIVRERRPAGSCRWIAGGRVKNLTVYRTITSRSRSQILAEITVPRFSKTTCAFHQSGRNRVLVRDALLLLGALIIPKEEQLVFDDRSANGAAVLLPGRWS